MCRQQRVHRDVTERIVTYLSVPQQACARRASKALWKAARAASMEDMLRAAVFEHNGTDTRVVDEQLVVVAMNRALRHFPSVDALLAWCGGLGPLYDELQLRFSHMATVGVSARLAAIRPFPFASGCATMTVCVVTAVASAPSQLVIESVVLGVRNTANLLVRTSALSDDGAPCPILCLEGATPEQFPNMLHDVPLSSLPSILTIEKLAFKHKRTTLQSVCLASLPLLESIGREAFSECLHLSSVDLSCLPSLRWIRGLAFYNCDSLQSVSLSNLPLLESIDSCAFGRCGHLSSLELSVLPALRTIGAYAFCECKSLQSISFANLPLLERIDNEAFDECVLLSSVDLSGHQALRTIGQSAFESCESLQSISLSNLPLLESIGSCGFGQCTHLSRVDLSGLQALRTIGDYAFEKCGSLQSINFSNLPLLESIGSFAFSQCMHLSSVDLSDLPSLQAMHLRAFEKCESLQSISAVNLPLLERIGLDAFAECARLSGGDSCLQSLCARNRAKSKKKRLS